MIQGLPRRTSEDIPVIRATELQLAARTWGFVPGKTSLVVIAKGTFALVQDGAARLAEASAFPTGQLRFEDGATASAVTANDYALLKPKVDVLLRGHAHAPRERARTSVVSFRLGGGRTPKLEKSLAVIGNRRWRRVAGGVEPTEPEPFTAIPLVHERAFGGAGHPSNPWGTGYGESAPLPNLEWPGNLVRSPSDTLPAACFAPVALEHPSRFLKLGTYDRRWLEERWPYFAADFDYGFFQDAPPDQQLDALTGDEPFHAEGVHPNLPVVRGQLPSVKARAFVVRRPSEALESVALRLDTVTFDFDAMTVDLVWRGALDVEGRDARDVQALFLAHESLSANMNVGEARALLEATLAARAAEDPPEDEAVAAVSAALPLEDAAEEDEPAPEEAALMAKLAALGVLLPGATADDELPRAPVEPAVLAATLRGAGVDEAEIAELMAALAPEPEASPPSGERTLDEATRLRRLVEERCARGESLAELELAGADLSDLDLCDRDLRRVNLRDATLYATRLERADLSEAQLGGARLEGASLEGANLTGADLTGAVLPRAKLARATLTDATFEEVTADGADFSGVRGEQTVFVRASLVGACFDGAALASPDFTEVRAEKARFVGATLSRARCYEADLRGVTLDGATLPCFRGEQADLSSASLVGVEAEGSVFESAKLDRATLRQARLTGSSFVRATARRADFSQVDLREGRLAHADLGGSILVRANLLGADLESANLVVADLRGANLHATNLWLAVLTDAPLGGAILTGSTLEARPR